MVMVVVVGVGVVVGVVVVRGGVFSYPSSFVYMQM